jgi:hypothetical protein
LSNRLRELSLKRHEEETRMKMEMDVNGKKPEAAQEQEQVQVQEQEPQKKSRKMLINEVLNILGSPTTENGVANGQGPQS